MGGRIGNTKAKLILLSQIAKELNNKNVTWAVGASLLLYLKGMTSEFHDIDINVRNTYSIEEKLNLLDEIDEAIFLLPRYFRTFDMINRLIKTGYWYRNPITKEYIRELDKLGREFQLQTSDYHFKYEQNGNTYAANGSKIMSMFGVIGTGKTTVLKEISNLYPSSILHDEYEGERFRFLQICPNFNEKKGV